MRFTFLTILLILLSCATMKQSDKLMIVEGKVQIHNPYCGGVKPTPEIAKGSLSPLSNTEFVVKSELNNDLKLKTISTFSTDENGNFNFKLPAGEYFVMNKEKIDSFESFKKKHNTERPKLFEYVGDSIALLIYKQEDFMLDVKGTTNYSFVLKGKCYTGINKLINYIGPLAP